MEKIEGPEVRSKILSFLRARGPSLPVHISKEIGLSTLFTSAFLSELAGDKEVKISDIKVGGSPVYLIPGHEIKLEKYASYLSGKEKEAFLLLKEKQVLDDKSQEPAIRVALRSLKDFAIPLYLNIPEGQRIFWRYFGISEEESKKLIEEIILKETPKIPEEKKKEPIAEIEDLKPVEPKPEKIQEQMQSPKEQKRRLQKQEDILVIDLLKQTQKPKEKSDFALKTISLFNSENIEILEEKESKKKEFYSIIRVNSELGKIKFLAVCKDKKKITSDDLDLALQKSQILKLPIFFCSTGSIEKKAEKYLEENSGLIKFRKLEF